MITDLLLQRISKIVSYFETSKEEPQYGQVTILPDGPNKIRQVTYGEHQTTEFGNLNILLKRYCDAGGKEKARLSLQGIGQMPSKWTNESFLKGLEAAGSDPIMQKIQDQFFKEFYMNPAIKWFTDNGFVYPLSLLVIYDSCVHSGGIPGFLRTRFNAVPPVKGGDEKQWLTQYVHVRDVWLEENKNRLLQNTDYRTDSFIYAIRNGNWFLDKPFTIGNYPDNEERKNIIVRHIV